MAIDVPRSKLPDETPVLGEPLTFHAPGWTIRTDAYEVMCWAPGPVVHQGSPTGEMRTGWLLAVEMRPGADHTLEPRRGRVWETGAFVAGDRLCDVLRVLALIDDTTRQLVSEVLVARLGSIVERIGSDVGSGVEISASASDEGGSRGS